MTKTTPEQNKAIVLEAFETLFNKRDYVAAERFWSDHYIQHSAHIAPGRAGLFDLIRTLPETLRYENQLIVAEGDYVNPPRPFLGHGPRCRVGGSSPPGGETMNTNSGQGATANSGEG